MIEESLSQFVAPLRLHFRLSNLPYYDGWALNDVGYREDVVKLLHLIDVNTYIGSIGQGYNPQGTCCQSNWVNIAEASAVAYPIHDLFEIWPGLGNFAPKPEPAGFDPQAYFEKVPGKGTLDRIAASGPVATGGAPAATKPPVTVTDTTR